MEEAVPNPLAPEQSLKRPLEGEQSAEAHPPQPIFPEDSAVTKAEKVEKHGSGSISNGSIEASAASEPLNEPPSKRIRVEQPKSADKVDSRDRVKGVALVKPE